MKLFLTFVLGLLLLGCNVQDQRRTLNDAYDLSVAYPSFDTFHFVVEANCDYEYFFDYPPMRNGGYYAYGYKDNHPLLLVIPKYATDDEKLMLWPINYTVSEAVDLLNTAYGDVLIEEESMYNNVAFELTSNVLNDYSSTDYDVSFFIVFTVDNVSYIAFQQDLNLIIYHETDGFVISSASLQ